MSNENVRGNQNYPTDSPDASSRDHSRADSHDPSLNEERKDRTGHRGSARSSYQSNRTTPKSSEITNNSFRPTHSDEQGTTPQYRLRFHFGEISLYSAWHAELAPIENLGVQLIQGSEFHDITIERCTEVTRR